MKALYKYPGSKWSLAKYIVSIIPEHKSYLEPFAGSLAVLFNKERSPIETVNDLDGNIVNLLKVIRDNPKQLAGKIYYTPYARKVFEETYTENDPKNDVEKALLFLERLNMGHGFRTTGERVGWKNDISGRQKAYAALDWMSLPDRVMEAAERLRGVQIECTPAIDVIKRFRKDNVLIYADPPYVLSTRNRKQYHFEMTDEDHEELLHTLMDHPGPVILSGYDNPLYNEMLKKWDRIELSALAMNSKKRTEIIWTNFSVA